VFRVKEGWIGRQTDRGFDRQTERWIDRQTDRQTGGGYTDRQRGI
jgi:hypothetical protein